MDYIQPHITKLIQQVKTNNKFIGIMLVVLVCIIAAAFISRKYLLPKVNAIQNSMSGASDGDVEGMATGPTDVYFFNVEWCPHCKTAKPEWDKLVKANEGDGQYKFHNIDCEKSSDLAKQFKVESYPTILKDNQGVISEYKKKPSESELQAFIDN
jgi:thiol-disulfide isomerase/thioredoxin